MTERKKQANTADNESEKDKSETQRERRAMAEGLPEWDLLPPAVLIRRATAT